MTTAKKTTAKKSVTKKVADKEVTHKLRIRVRAYENKVLDNSVKQIVDTALRYDAEVIGPMPLPTEIKKYTVNRSPFIYKNTREQFEIRTHKRVIDILNPNPKTIDPIEFDLKSLTLKVALTALLVPKTLPGMETDRTLCSATVLTIVTILEAEAAILGVESSAHFTPVATELSALIIWPSLPTTTLDKTLAL